MQKALKVSLFLSMFVLLFVGVTVAGCVKVYAETTQAPAYLTLPATPIDMTVEEGAACTGDDLSETPYILCSIAAVFICIIAWMSRRRRKVRKE